MAEDLENFVKVTGMDPARASEFMAKFGQRINAMQEQQASSQGQDVAVVDSMANSPIAQGAPALPPANNEGSALDAINNIEQAGEKMMAETGMDHDAELTENEKALQRTLAQNQTEDEEEDPQPSRVGVRPSGQRSIFDRPE